MTRRLVGWSKFRIAGMGAVLLCVAGCGGTDEALRSDVARLEQRVAELERTAGHYQVQLNGLEEDVLLLEDRVEAHRLSLERRGMVATRDREELPAYRPPEQEPDFAYMAELPVHRLAPEEAAPAPPPDDERLEELVITNDTLQQFVEENGGVPEDIRAGARSAAHQPMVVGERLPVSQPRSDRQTARVSRGASGRATLDLYQESLREFNAGSYDAALAGFEAFLEAGPEEDYQDNAYYWIGECHYARGEYQDALAAFERVVRDYPNGNKVPDSLLKIGLTHEQLNNREQAGQVLARLVDTYPLTDAAHRASQRLADFN